MKKLVCGLALVSMYGCEQVDTGYRGIKTEFGKVIGEPLEEGLHWYNPFSSAIIEMDVREHKLEAEADCFTKDTQKVRVTFAMTYYPDPSKIHTLFQNLGKNWAEKIVLPVTLGSIKATIGKYVADDLVGKRQEAKDAAEREIMENLRSRSVIATRIDFTHLDFEDAYEKSVEEKVVALQTALKAKNETVMYEEKAKQKIMAAQADAESMRIKNEALSKNPALINYEIALKWDGKLPNYMFGSTIPMVNIDNLKKSP